MENKKLMLIGLLRSLRPKDWIKNVVVFVALVFSDKFLDAASVLQSLIAFVLFCMMSSSTYILNDLADLEEDRKNPRKAKRPLASGLINPAQALCAALCLAAVGLGLGFWLDTLLGVVLASYWVANLFYSFSLKRLIILDVMLIALGFVLRAIGGAVVLHVRVSPWLVITTMFLALFLALSKRKAELIQLGEEAQQARGVLQGYSRSLLDQLILITVTSTILSYALYSFDSPHSPYMLWTVPFVIYGLFRYMYLTEAKGLGEQLTDALLKDWPLIIAGFLWGLSVLGILIYF
jgi:4-hydroxybenzoate polyprenyltransferase